MRRDSQVHCGKSVGMYGIPRNAEFRALRRRFYATSGAPRQYLTNRLVLRRLPLKSMLPVLAEDTIVAGNIAILWLFSSMPFLASSLESKSVTLSSKTGNSPGFVLLLLTLLLAPPAKTAQESYTPVRDRSWQLTSFTSDAGAGNARVFDIAFETNGTVWLATTDGLRRYDGYQWQRFDTNDHLPSSFIRSVCVTSKGELWVGSDAGAGVFDHRTKRYDRRGADESLPGKGVRQIAEDPDGALWFSCDQWPDPTATVGGLGFLRDGQWKTYNRDAGLPMDYVIHYFRDSKARRFATTSRGWVQWNGQSWGPPRDPGYEAEDRILMLAEDKQGQLFAQGETSLLILSGGQWRAHGAETTIVCSTREGKVYGVARDFTRGLLHFCQWTGQRFEQVSAVFLHPPEGRLYKIAEAPDGSLWCVGYGTVVRWHPGAHEWKFHPDLPPPHTVVGTNGIWFGGRSNVVAMTQGRFIPVKGMRQILAVDPQGSAWGISLKGDRLLRAELTQAAEPVEVDCGLEKHQSALVDPQGRLWVFGRSGPATAAARCRQGREWNRIESPELANHRILASTADSTGTIWLALQRDPSVEFRIARISEGKVGFEAAEHTPKSVLYPSLASGAGYVWLHGYSSLYRRPVGTRSAWERVTNILDTGFQQMVVPDQELLTLYHGGRGGSPGCALFSQGQWTNLHGSFNRMSLASDKQTVFLLDRGGFYLRQQPGNLDLNYVSLPVDAYALEGTLTPDGSMWIGTPEGVFHYTPAAAPPQTLISEGQPEVGPERNLLITFGGRKRFSPDNPPESYRYSWRVDGGAWGEFVHWPGNHLNPAQLGEPAPGTHVLEIRARDAFGNTDDTPAQHRFEVLPTPLQQKPWFRPAVALLGILIAALVWIGINRTRTITRTNAALTREIEVRRAAEAELQRARDELEVRVKQRTAQLSRSNESLTREISERKQAEETRRVLEEQLRHSQKMEAIGTLAGGIAHDFNNILAAIIPHAHLAKEDSKENASVQESLDEVLAASERARNLVQQILAFSRQQKQERRLLDLTHVVQEALRLIRCALPASIELVQEYEPDLPPVPADATQLHQVVVNLCTNAAQAMKDRPGRIQVKVTSVKAPSQLALSVPGMPLGESVCLSVRDEGCGMAPSLVGRIFEPFFTTKGPGEGTGLGLAVVHGIVRDHNGAIRVQSEPGLGSVFEVFLPAQEGKPSSASPEAPQKVQAQGEKILLVDDEPAVCGVVAKTLTRAGYQVSAHLRPEDALTAFMENPQEFRLVITDLSMPGMTGTEFAARVYARRPELPILLATGFGGSWGPETTSVPSIRETMQKPMPPGTLVEMVRRYVRPG